MATVHLQQSAAAETMCICRNAMQRNELESVLYRRPFGCSSVQQTDEERYFAHAQEGITPLAVADHFLIATFDPLIEEIRMCGDISNEKDHPIIEDYSISPAVHSNRAASLGLVGLVMAR